MAGNEQVKAGESFSKTYTVYIDEEQSELDDLVGSEVTMDVYDSDKADAEFVMSGIVDDSEAADGKATVYLTPANTTEAADRVLYFVTRLTYPANEGTYVIDDGKLTIRSHP